jgi:hypothetical protein
VTEKVLANTTAFILPSIPNIADTLAQFQQDAAKVDVELLIAIDPSTGKIMKSNKGDTHNVGVPKGCEGLFLMHSHATLNSPISVADIEVIPIHQVVGNMAVCGDGGVSWCSGLHGGIRVAMAMEELCQGGSIDGMDLLSRMFGGRNAGSAALNWMMLDYFTAGTPELSDLHVLAGTDMEPYSVAKMLGCRLPQSFSWVRPAGAVSISSTAGITADGDAELFKKWEQRAA